MPLDKSVHVKLKVDNKFTDKIGERNFPPHPGDGWASNTAKVTLECPRCGDTIRPGETVIGSGYSDHFRPICACHSPMSLTLKSRGVIGGSGE